jgi:hypothetical protein
MVNVVDPQSSLKPKTWSFVVWLGDRKWIHLLFSKFQNSSTITKQNISQAFQEHQAYPIPIPYKTQIMKCLKWLVN